MKTFYRIYFDNTVDYHIFGFVKIPYHFNGKSGEQVIPVWHCCFVDDEEYTAKFWKALYKGEVDPINEDYQSDTKNVGELYDEREEWDVLIGTTEHDHWGEYGVDTVVWPEFAAHV